IQGADSAAGQYMRSTGQGSGSAGGEAQRSLLRALGGAQAAGAADDMVNAEQRYQSSRLEAESAQRLGALGSAAGLSEQEAGRYQQQNQWQAGFDREGQIYDDQRADQRR